MSDDTSSHVRVSHLYDELLSLQVTLEVFIVSYHIATTAASAWIPVTRSRNFYYNMTKPISDQPISVLILVLVLDPMLWFLM